MKPPRKLISPTLPEELVPMDRFSRALLDMLEDDEDIEGIRFEGVTFDPLSVHRASFRACAFDKCTFLADEEDDDGTIYDFVDCVFQGCDFAGAQMNKGAFQRVAFRSCRGVGLYLSEATLRSVTFDDCQLGYANFGLSKITAVKMTGCDLSHATFGYAKLDSLQWEKCRLSGAELFGTKLAGMDLRTNEIDGIVLGDRTELVGATVTPLQACGLALLLGVIVD